MRMYNSSNNAWPNSGQTGGSERERIHCERRSILLFWVETGAGIAKEQNRPMFLHRSRTTFSNFVDFTCSFRRQAGGSGLGLAMLL